MAIKAPKFILGVDIGYSNLKTCYGYSDQSITTLIKPATAMPLKNLWFDELFCKANKTGNDQMVYTQIDGEGWHACMDLSSMSEYVREQNYRFTVSKHYHALFNAALIDQPCDQVDLVVTSLPLSLYSDKSIREDLRRKIIGRHQVADARRVDVFGCEILPHTIGAYCCFLRNEAVQQDLRNNRNGYIAVVDIGYHTLEIGCFINGEQSSLGASSSHQATHRVLKKCTEIINKEYGPVCSETCIEGALQNNKYEIEIGILSLDFIRYIKQASEEVDEEAIREMKNAFSELNKPPFLIVLTGGGASLFRAAIEREFPSSKITQMGIASLAIGLWEKGRLKALFNPEVK